MRIVLDLQGAQSASRYRGIGRYSLALAQAIARRRGEHELYILLNGGLSDSVVELRRAFADLLPAEHIIVFSIPQPVAAEAADNAGRRGVAELLREACIARLRPDVVHISSLFEGYLDDAVSSVGRLAQHALVSVSLYDLIPWLNQEHYLTPRPAYAAHYREKMAHLQRADLLLAISEASCQEARTHLPGQQRIVNIAAAADACFTPGSASAARTRLRPYLASTRPFVLYTGGADERKNLPRLLAAFDQLPATLRDSHQLVLAGRLSTGEVDLLREQAQSLGWSDEQWCLTGYVDDATLVDLYRACTLFVFPSWHEGFGLPALEAMSCGAAVLAAHTSSLPEVIGRQDALFDPFSVVSIAAKIEQGLVDTDWRQELCRHGREQARRFSWDHCADLALAAFSQALAERAARPRPALSGKPRLAFVSPLPPERTGIADYSSMLLPALALHYELHLVVAQTELQLPEGLAVAGVHTPDWLLKSAPADMRVLYHMGNSPFHRHMLALLAQRPGVVVMHDIYLSGLIAWLDRHGGAPGLWATSLYEGHGYSAVRQLCQDADETAVQRAYPVSLAVLQTAAAIIVHSQHARHLAQQHYPGLSACSWQVLPLLRLPPRGLTRADSRARLGLAESDFIVCSFGFLDPRKLNHRLLAAWAASSLAQAGNCRLIFVGANHGGGYGEELVAGIACLRRHSVSITGYVDGDDYERYLAAADVIVQLRTHSHGETSASALDALNQGLPTIVNAHGSLAELPAAVVWSLPEDFTDAELTEALQTLYGDGARRDDLAERARLWAHQQLSPAACGEHYRRAIEAAWEAGAGVEMALLDALAALPDPGVSETALAGILAQDLPLPAATGRRLLLDISATCRNQLQTGIERVARALLLALLQREQTALRIEPVYLDRCGDTWCYRYARQYTLELLACPAQLLEDAIVEPRAGDILLTLDLAGQTLVAADQQGLFAFYRRCGVRLYAMLHDLLPLRQPQVFPPGADTDFAAWLAVTQGFDGAVCVSRTVAEDLADWRAQQGITRSDFRIEWSHHGADFLATFKGQKRPVAAAAVLAQLAARPSFLMVGTIEPRKGHDLVLQACSELWRRGVACNLVIVGREGWQHLPDPLRRDLPMTLASLRQHAQRGHYLHWLEGADDDLLQQLYRHSSALIFASHGEGFGLPLIEAAQHELPIIARDLPVFREVAGEYASYFTATTAAALADVLADWLRDHAAGRQRPSRGMPWLTWAASAEHLCEILLGRTALPSLQGNTTP